MSIGAGCRMSPWAWHSIFFAVAPPACGGHCRRNRAVMADASNNEPHFIFFSRERQPDPKAKRRAATANPLHSG